MHRAIKRAKRSSVEAKTPPVCSTLNISLAPDSRLSLTRYSVVDAIVSSPEPEDRFCVCVHLHQTLARHVLKVFGTRPAAEEAVDVASHRGQHLGGNWTGMTRGQLRQRKSGGKRKRAVFRITSSLNCVLTNEASSMTSSPQRKVQSRVLVKLFVHVNKDDLCCSVTVR